METSGPILAIDYGRRHMGVAISDSNRQFSSPLPTINSSSANTALFKLKEMAATQGAVMLLLGNPLGRDQKPTQISQEVAVFATKLSELTGLPFKLWDETGSSRLAGAALSQKNSHSQAAALLLQEYLDFQNTGI